MRLLRRSGEVFAAKPEPIVSEEARWAAQDVAGWYGRGVHQTKFELEAARLAGAVSSIYRVDIAGGKVQVRGGAASPAVSVFERRIANYCRMLEDTIRAFRLDIATSLLIDVNDMSHLACDVPIFAFQRKVEERSILLLPDVDLVGSGFDISPAVRDDRRWADKENSAVFTGSTTGGFSSIESVRAGTLPRLAAATYFKNVPSVLWELPNIVQCDSIETVELIRSMQLGNVVRSWTEQFCSRIILSMDGNGATCSRVSIALASNSVLAKFASDRELYYFRGLKSGQEYLQLDTFADVEPILSQMAKTPGTYEAVATAGRVFATRHLSRLAAFHYVAELLVRYARLMKGEEPPVSGAVLAGESILAELIVTMAAGERRAGPLNGWAGTPRSRRYLRRVALRLTPSLPTDCIRLDAVDTAGRASSTTGQGDEAGAGEGEAITRIGFSVPPSSADLDVQLEALFVDGSYASVSDAGTMAGSPTGAALEALRLHVSRR